MLDGSVAYVGEEVGISYAVFCLKEEKARKLGVTQLKSPMSTRSNFSSLRMLAMVGRCKVANLILQTEVLETAEALRLRLPDTVDDILDVQDVVGLGVAGVAERDGRR